MRARQAAEVEKVTARMRHLDKFGPSEYLWSGVRDELEGVTRENEAPSEAGPANEPWQEQHWSERLPQSPEKGAPGEWEEQWDDSAATGATGRPVTVGSTRRSSDGDAGAAVRCGVFMGGPVADSPSAHGPRRALA